MADAGRLLKEAGHRHGTTQKSLAMRARTTQSAISRIESGRVSPTVATLEELLFLLGEDLNLDSKPRESDVDLQALAERLRLTPTQRIERGLEDAERAIEENPDRVRGV